MSDLLNFDARTVNPQQAFEPIPANWYRAAIVESGVKPTKNGDGSYLSLQFKVLDGPFKDRTVFANLNLKNPNAQTVEIAQQQLSAICHAIGVLQLTNSQQLHDRPMMIKVTVKQSEGYDPQNQIKGFKAVEGGAGAAPSAAAPASAAKPAATAPGWTRKAS